jgi:hypothetical protein
MTDLGDRNEASLAEASEMEADGHVRLRSSITLELNGF